MRTLEENEGVVNVYQLTWRDTQRFQSPEKEEAKSACCFNLDVSRPSKLVSSDAKEPYSLHRLEDAGAEGDRNKHCCVHISLLHHTRSTTILRR